MTVNSKENPAWEEAGTEHIVQDERIDFRRKMRLLLQSGNCWRRRAMHRMNGAPDYDF